MNRISRSTVNVRRWLTNRVLSYGLPRWIGHIPRDSQIMDSLHYQCTGRIVLPIRGQTLERFFHNYGDQVMKEIADDRP